MTASKKGRYLIGIDEVGRGPLAGPVAVGAVIVKGKVPSILRPGKDSKQLTPEAREMWFEKIQAAKKTKELDFAVSFISPKNIDTKGLSFAIKKALKLSLDKVLKNKKIRPEQCLVLLDGGLKAPAEFIHQKTIIKGDEKEAIIALASIAAKVQRDRKMVRFALKFPDFGFDVHKGYGTRGHYEKIKKHGLTAIHRRSFLQKIEI